MIGDLTHLPLEIFTESTEQTEEFGAALAKSMAELPDIPRYIALRGDLGVGKTAFVRGFCTVAAPGSAVRSPTFALVNEYRAPLPVFHFDMYRICDEDDLYSIGYDDYLEHGICIVEWSEKIPFALPHAYLRLTIEKISGAPADRRRLLLESVG